jgi:hypothetical protein
MQQNLLVFPPVGESAAFFSVWDSLRLLLRAAVVAPARNEAGTCGWGDGAPRWIRIDGGGRGGGTDSYVPLLLRTYYVLRTFCSLEVEMKSRISGPGTAGARSRLVWVQMVPFPALDGYEVS